MVLDESVQKVLGDLRRKRGVIKASLTRIQTYISKFNPREDPVTLLEFRQEELPQINRKFDDVQCQIELIDVEGFDDAVKEREVFENAYFSIRSDMQQIINAEKSLNTSMNNSSINTANGHSHRVRLPPISLPSFDGNIQEWESFFDCFKAIVHEDNAYPAVQKFSYLRSTLSGQALDVIKGIPITENNYEVAVRKLQQRYDNKGLVIQSHIRAILDCKHVESTSGLHLQNLHSDVSAHVAALEALGQPIQHWDAWLVTIVLRKLDQKTSQDWQLQRTNTELPRYAELEHFLSNRCVALEGSEMLSKDSDGYKDSQSAISPKAKKNYQYNNSKKGLITATDRSARCICCSEFHKLYACNKFKELSAGDRVTLVRDSRLCFNCLCPSHMASSCRSTFSCRLCKRRHNTLLHFENSMVSADRMEIQTSQVNPSNQPSTSQEPSVSAAASLSPGSEQGYVFLSTALVFTVDRFGNQRQCRAILDSGSQVNFISGSLANRLHLRSQKSTLPVSGIGESRVQALSYVEVSIQSRLRDYRVKLVCYVLPTIVSKIPACPNPARGWEIPEDLLSELADPHFYNPGAVDLLIGGGVFFDITSSTTVRKPLNVKNICLNDSQFGWIVTGELGAVCLAGVRTVGEALEENWRAMADREESCFGRLSKTNQRSREEEETLQHFRDTFQRNQEGRFVLRLPIKEEHMSLGNSLAMATSRFINIERRLQRDDHLRKEYTNFMTEYINMGHMYEVIATHEVSQDACYLPHHPVIKSSSLTTKTRVVFDASAKTQNGTSLNDMLKRGPTVQEDIFSILTRFQKHQYVLTADIEKMFRQIMIAKEDHHLQRILWRDHPHEALRTYALATVTYGTTPASFMATQCLVVLGEEAKKRSSKISDVILRDFYMDDLMTGCDTEDECIQLQEPIASILDSAKLPLRKWCSNSSSIIARIGKNQDDALFTLDLGDGDIIKSLGLCWQPFVDQFRFNITIPVDRSNLTKRKLLSDLNKVFDPLGFLGPVLIIGKIFKNINYGN
ncbi:uncharacterized protein LOC132918997 [Rhopalosiphum padi]|uniref:uncharacterized protein LOC132918997 n=1 Tax=Rhopalosiphum padi TaxID=40932 RepID=UPI00298DFD66|nr:uncharacterized protein LOC132918997 [Rhopalosiphum padi]